MLVQYHLQAAPLTYLGKWPFSGTRTTSVLYWAMWIPEAEIPPNLLIQGPTGLQQFCPTRPTLTSQPLSHSNRPTLAFAFPTLTNSMEPDSFTCPTSQYMVTCLEPDICLTHQATELFPISRIILVCVLVFDSYLSRLEVFPVVHVLRHRYLLFIGLLVNVYGARKQQHSTTVRMNILFIPFTTSKNQKPSCLRLRYLGSHN